MIKTYVLDTNVLIESPESIFSFDDNNIIIPDVVIEELDKLKTGKGDIGYNAREAIRILESLRHKGNLSDGVVLRNGGYLKIEFNHLDESLPSSWDLTKPDNRIIRVAKGVNGILVSKDITMRIKASIIGLPSEDYKSNSINESPHLGRMELLIMHNEIEDFYKNKELIINLNEDEVYQNDYVQLKTPEGQSALARIEKNKIVPLRFKNYNPYDILPRNAGQRFAIDALMTSSKILPLVILKGPAGTAKTFLSLAVALEKILNTDIDEREYRKILITRGNVKMDNDIGYLKGDETEKTMPLLRSFTDNLEQLIDKKRENVKGKIEYLFESGIIEVQALAYMRGRTLTKTFIIVDEAQNLTPNQVLSIVTRVGEGSKLVLIGDPDQIDNTFLDKNNNGLVFASERMKGEELCAQVNFKNSECTRSDIAKLASKKLCTKGYSLDKII